VKLGITDSASAAGEQREYIAACHRPREAVCLTTGMPRMRTTTKSPTQQAHDRSAAAGPHGIALPPPAYGLHVVDRAVSKTAVGWTLGGGVE
jgi:hypothetical protein